MPVDAAANVPAWVSLLVQVPLVGVFIWYSLRLADESAKAQQRFMDALDKRDDAFTKRNLAVIEAIHTMQTAVIAELRETRRCQEEHDRWVQENVARRRAK